MSRALSLLLPVVLLAACVAPDRKEAASVAAPAPAASTATLLLDGVPAAEARIAARLKPYLEARPASFLGWTAQGGVLATTRFGSTAQLHHIAQPLGAREQQTFLAEPVLWAAAARVADREVWVYQHDVGGNEAFQLSVMDPLLAQTRRLTDGGSRNERPVLAADGRQLAWSSTARNGRDSDIWVAPVDGSAAPRAVYTPGGSWYPLDFSPDSSRLLVQLYRSITDSELWEVELASGTARNLFPDAAPAARPMARYHPITGQIWLASDYASEWVKLYRYDAEGQLWPVGDPARPFDVEGFDLSPDGARVAVVTNDFGSSALYVHEIEPWTEVGKLTIDHGVIARPRFSADSSQVAFGLTGPKTPGDVFSLTIPEQVLVRWTRGEVGGLPREQFVEPSKRHFGAFDAGALGLPRQIPFYLYLPAGEGPFPVVIVVHGGPEAQTRASFDAWAQFLARELQVAVLEPNVRGSSGYGKTFLSEDNGLKRQKAVDDLRALVAWARSQPNLDAERIVVTGGSYGGFMTLAAATQFPEQIAAAVSTVGISHFVTFLESTSEYRRDLRRAEYGDERIPEVRAFLEQISPLTQADRISKPLFVLQGLNDPRVPVGESRQIVEAARARGVPTWYFQANNEGHGFRKQENREAALIATVQFFEAHLLKGRKDGGPEQIDE
ncbi:MAG: alpha/beta fold hydrolase [Xanthomonadales bacterium]|jgi:dipeptidyl aminopeptidase/acylaminoacyl peptidase|nr:alpha/beta fold hydrolase [Xanthomonadales bacterium]